MADSQIAGVKNGAIIRETDIKQEMIMKNEEVEDLKKEVAELKKQVKASRPSLFKQGMHFVYNVGNTHAIMKNFGWAMTDCAKAAAFVGTAAVSAAKASPKVAKKAIEALKDNPKVAAIGAAVAVTAAAAEYATRYEDEEGNTKHRCSIM